MQAHANCEHVCDVRCTQVIVSLILQVQVQEGKKVNLPAAVALDVPELNAIALRVHIDAVRYVLPLYVCLCTVSTMTVVALQKRYC
jgi:hypothetical protein